MPARLRSSGAVSPGTTGRPEPYRRRAVRLTATAGAGGYASAAEIAVAVRPAG
ncbi:MAG: hypothetical protein JWN00_2186 [Actinomycetia bacterium]|jgi:hypothetical protein|nr:hypothetical protein [Actinomycetes bacterium]